MNTLQARESVIAANELLSAKVEKDGKQFPLLGYKKITLAHSLGKVVDGYQTLLKRYDESRQKLLDELGDKLIAFSSESDLDFSLCSVELTEDQKKEHKGRKLYQATEEEFEKIDKSIVKLIRNDLYWFTPENAAKFKQAEAELANQSADIVAHIPIEAFQDIDFSGIVVKGESILKSENDAVTIILMLHEIVEA